MIAWRLGAGETGTRLAPMTNKPKAPAPPKLTDAERSARFKEAARLVEASEDPKDFDAAFAKLTGKTPPKA